MRRGGRKQQPRGRATQERERKKRRVRKGEKEEGKRKSRLRDRADVDNEEMHRHRQWGTRANVGQAATMSRGRICAKFDLPDGATRLGPQRNSPVRHRAKGRAAPAFPRPSKGLGPWPWPPRAGRGPVRARRKQDASRAHEPRSGQPWPTRDEVRGRWRGQRTGAQQTAEPRLLRRIVWRLGASCSARCPILYLLNTLLAAPPTTATDT